MTAAAPILAIAGSLAFTALVAWLHVRRRDLDPRTRGVSHYAVGPTRGVMTVAFLALAVGTSGITAAFDPALGGVAWLRAAALGITLVALVPVPGPDAAAWRGPVHALGALGFFVAAAVGAVLLSARVNGAAVLIAWMLAVAVVVFLASMAGVPGLFAIRGWLQRGCFALVAAWLLIAGWHSWPRSAASSTGVRLPAAAAIICCRAPETTALREVQ